MSIFDSLFHRFFIESGGLICLFAKLRLNWNQLIQKKVNPSSWQLKIGHLKPEDILETLPVNPNLSCLKCLTKMQQLTAIKTWNLIEIGFKM